MNIGEMIEAATAAVKHRKPTSNDGRAEYVEALTWDLERAKDALQELAEMADELLTAIQEVGEAESMADMRDHALIDTVREKAQCLVDGLVEGVNA